MKIVKTISHTLASTLLLTGISFSAHASFYDDGLVAFAKGDYKNATALFEKAVAAGEAGAEHMLVRLHSEGVGIQKDQVESFKWALASAEKGVMQSQFTVAEMYAAGEGVERNPAKAYHWFREAAKQGHHVAYFRIAEMLEQGTVAKASADEVKRLYLVAATDFDVYAQKGDAKSQTSLASMYEQGLGVEKNIAMAINWYHKAANQGYAVAQYHMGRLYAESNDVEINVAEAKYWLEKAASQGYGKAQQMLAELKELDGPEVALADF